MSLKVTEPPSQKRTTSRPVATIARTTPRTTTVQVSESGMPLRCLKPTNQGRCVPYRVEVRWNFKENRKNCFPFIYLGCAGTDVSDQNNFQTKAQCLSVCQKKGITAFFIYFFNNKTPVRLPFQLDWGGPFYPSQKSQFSTLKGRCRNASFCCLNAHASWFLSCSSLSFLSYSSLSNDWLHDIRTAQSKHVPKGHTASPLP